MLQSIRILDLSRLLPGPAATWFLASHGAKVDMVETKKGDLTRHLPPIVNGQGSLFRAINAGKRSLCIDFRHECAAELLLSIVGEYDVLIEGFRPGVLEQIGLEPDKLMAAYPQLIIVRLSGYGQKGPYAQRVGHDINYIAEVGILYGQEVGERGHALPCVQIADMSAALQCAFQISMALFSRQQDGKGRVLDISLTESALAMYAPMLSTFWSGKRNAQSGGEWLSGGVGWYGTYRCSDDKYIAVGAVEAKFQAVLAKRAGDVSRTALAQMFIQETQEYWVSYFNNACVSAVRTSLEVLESPWLASQHLIYEDRVRAPGGQILEESPQLGQHNEKVLADAGITDTQIQTWKQEGLLCGQ